MTSHPVAATLFPPKIERAFSLVAARGSVLNELSNNARLLLAEMLRVVDAASPGTPFRISMEVLTKGIQQSHRTVHRSKHELESAGWITRSQVQSRRLGMQISDICLTGKALKALELLSTSTKQSRRTSSIPLDLQILLHYKISTNGIFALMALAKKHAAKLSDIIFCIKDYLPQAERPYGYIKACINNSPGFDWANKKAQNAAQDAECLRYEDFPKPDPKSCHPSHLKKTSQDTTGFGLSRGKLEEITRLMLEGQPYASSLLQVRYKRLGTMFFKMTQDQWRPTSAVGLIYGMLVSGQLQGSP